MDDCRVEGENCGKRVCTSFIDSFGLLTTSRIIEMAGTGYGDRGFTHHCTRCTSLINHDMLRVAKFKKDAENLIMNDWPLGGTILSTTGELDAAPFKDSSQNPTQFSNRLVRNELRSQVLELVNSSGSPTVDDIKQLIEKAIQNKSVVRKVNNSWNFGGGIPNRGERLAIRKMMSRYWENSSIFALELGGAVIRQSVFVGKMQGLDWLHSPSARQTMERLLNKYTRFIDIMAAYPAHVAVPTLDVDLAWHCKFLSSFIE
jgi:hypothetical protein